jgi:hypothetical protein
MAAAKKTVRKKSPGAKGGRSGASGAARARGADPLTSFRMYEEIKAIVLLAVGAFLVFAMFAEGAGVVGEKVSYACKGAIGVMAYVLPFVLIAYAIAIFANKGYKISVRTHVFVVVMFFMLMLLISAFWLEPGSDSLGAADVGKVFAASAEDKSGGVAGMYAGDVILGLIGRPGLFILSIAALAVSALLFARTTLSERFERIAQVRADMREKREEREEEQRRLEEAAAKARDKADAARRNVPAPAAASAREASAGEAPRAGSSYGYGAEADDEGRRGGLFAWLGGSRRRQKDNANHIIDAVKHVEEHVSGRTGLQDEKLTGLGAGAEGAAADSPAESLLYGIEPHARAPQGRGLDDDYSLVGPKGLATGTGGPPAGSGAGGPLSGGDAGFGSSVPDFRRGAAADPGSAASSGAAL